MPSPVTGLHHVSAIVGPAQQTMDVYGGLLGLRFVKKTVNFDDPGTYHLYFADDRATPGSFMTFFPWGDGAMRGRVGAPQATATAYAAPEGAADLWLDRLASHAPTVGVDFDAPAERFGETVLTLRDPDGLVIEIVESADAEGGWQDGPIPMDAALGAFHSVTLATAQPDATMRVLTDALGYEEHAEADGRVRFVNPKAERARFVDVFRQPGEAGRMGAGTVHHIAFRVPDDEAELETRELLLQLGLKPTPQIDRQYFHSVYAREPGGVLFEIATDPPGFDVDEPADSLGRALKLPPQYEPQREAIEARLAPLTLPY
ncbi:MAG TPA: ring-cleaving dioxygenase [Bacteroidetes bacterium]|nr:ring-cleaving dioxygenase [Bacteroidota bacterium]HIL58900.1 ring-cleaving dioxygenase [Rhodothermales bacterium]